MTTIGPPGRFHSSGERPETLRVFGRLPGMDAMRDTEAGVRKASKEETAGLCAPAVGSGYGDLARGDASPGRLRAERRVNERREGDFGWCGAALWR